MNMSGKSRLGTKITRPSIVDGGTTQQEVTSVSLGKPPFTIVVSGQGGEIIKLEDLTHFFVLGCNEKGADSTEEAVVRGSAALQNISQCEILYLVEVMGRQLATLAPPEHRSALASKGPEMFTGGLLDQLGPGEVQVLLQRILKIMGDDEGEDDRKGEYEEGEHEDMLAHTSEDTDSDHWSPSTAPTRYPVIVAESMKRPDGSSYYSIRRYTAKDEYEELRLCDTLKEVDAWFHARRHAKDPKP